MTDLYAPEWVLNCSSTVYMDGTSVYYLHRPGEPGIVGSLALTPDEAAALLEVIKACLEVEYA